MYMHYHHELGPRPPPREIRRRYDESNPYTKFRDNPPVGGPRLAVPPPVSSPSNVIQLERIQLHCMMKSAVANKSNLLPIIMAFRALSGETLKGGGRHTSKGVELVHGRTNVGSWIRPNIPVGAKVDIRGQPMWDLTAALVEFVLPRLRGFNGFKLPKAGARWDTPSAVSGVVSIGLPTEAMGLFPQIEVNVEEYPNLSGMHIHFITNATGRGAQDRARSLVSGLGLPFIRSECVFSISLPEIQLTLTAALNIRCAVVNVVVNVPKLCYRSINTIVQSFPS